MAGARGRLTPLAIGTIFLVVFGAMHLGVQHSRGELLDRDPPSELERQLHAELWAAADAARADRGLDPAQRDTSVRTAARETAGRLASVDYFAAPTAAGVRPEAEGMLPDRVGLCDRLPAKLTVTEPGWTPGDGDVPAALLRSVARRAVDLLASAGPVDLLGRTNTYKHGIGVAIDGDAVYVVYRTCNLGY
jgi:hypothetical protein